MCIHIYQERHKFNLVNILIKQKKVSVRKLHNKMTVYALFTEPPVLIVLFPEFY